MTTPFLPGTALCLTMNPSVDVSTHAPSVVPADKLRCGPAQREPGGGGLNVARVVQRLGGQASAIYPAGGPGGAWLDAHLLEIGLPARRIPIAGETRENFTVQALDSGAEYRFVLPGPTLSEPEWQACLDAIDALPEPPAFLVASGSLPPGVPADFYARVTQRARRRGIRVILDSSGSALAAGLGEGVFLVKPNLRELGELLGEALDQPARWRGAAQQLVDAGQAEVVALSLGERGALLVTRDQAWQAAALPITLASSVGAGDSFVGAMTWALQAGLSLPDAFAWGVAAGSAALITPGTGLCRLADIQRLRSQVSVQALVP
ncbi:MAG: 1-phosphofructokinase family hexose kinase [Hydrogenophaga sp.]|jgi:6-phosphofructokinase 2|nr:1-phosphofructokinase family hexose kinase [Hydrogenophaga sp.]